MLPRGSGHTGCRHQHKCKGRAQSVSWSALRHCTARWCRCCARLADHSGPVHRTLCCSNKRAVYVPALCAVRCVVSSSEMTVGAIYPMEYSMHCAEPAACNLPCCKPKPASAAARISLSVSRCTEGPLPSAAAAEWIDDVGTVFAPAESDRWAMVCSTPSRAERSHQKEPKTRAWRTQKEWPQRTVCRRASRSVPLQRCNAAPRNRASAAH